MGIEGKVAVVLGGARGIGKETVKLLAEKGAKICVGDIQEDEGNALAAEVNNTTFIKCDVTIDKDVQDFFATVKDKFGAISIVVNSAGIIDEVNWHKCMEVNLGGLIRSTYAALGCMGKDKGGDGGVIINISTVCGMYPYDPIPVFASVSSGITTFTRGWAAEPNFSKHGVRLNVCSPTIVQTDMFKGVDPNNPILLPGQIELIYAQAHMFGEIMQPDYVAKGIMTLIEDESSNGVNLIVQPNGYDKHDYTAEYRPKY